MVLRRSSMKTLLCLMLFAVTCRAQTVKWTIQTPAPSFVSTEAQLWHGKTDAAGTVAFGVNYFDASGFLGTKLFWYSSAGKLLGSQEFQPSFRFNAVLYVSPSCLVVQMTDGTHASLRKYTRRGLELIPKDTQLSDGEGVPGVPNNGVEFTDRLGFFTISQGVSGVTVKRYLR